MSSILIVFLGSRGGGVYLTWELFKALRTTPSNNYSTLISSNNPLLSEYNKLYPTPLIVVKTHARSFGQVLWHSILLVRPLMIVGKILKANPDVVYFSMEHSWMPIIVVFLRLFRPRIKIVYTKHNPFQFDSLGSGIQNRILHAVDVFLIKKSHVIFTYSEFVKKSILLGTKVSANSVFSFHLGIVHHPHNSNWTHHGFCKSNTLRLLFFGRILSYKGIDVLAKSYELLKNENIPVQLTIAGEGEIDPICHQQLKRLGAIVMNHWISETELESLLAETDLFIAPYTRASQSGPVSTAVAYAIPAIVSDIGGLAEQVRNGINGIIVKPGQPQEIVSAVKKIYHEPSLLKKYSQGAKELSEGDFSWKTIAREMDASFSVILQATKMA